MPFFRDSPSPVRAEMALAARPALLQAGDFFYRERDACAHFALAAGGDIRVYRSGAEGREVTLYHVTAGQPCLVNLLSVLLGEPAMAAARAEAQTPVILFPGGALDPWMAASAALRRFVFASLAGRMARAISLVDDIAFRRIDSRLASLLLDRFAGNRVIELTHEEIAAELGTAREVVSRVLHKLALSGAVEVARGRIVLLDARVLREII